MVYKNKIDSNASKAESVLSSLLHKTESKRKSLEVSKNKIKKFKLNSFCCFSFNIIIGILLILLGILTILNPLYDCLLNQQVAFRKGFPPFENWFNNDVIIRCKVHIFNFTNIAEYINGTDEKLKIKELEPIIFYEHEIITNPIWNTENSSLSYNMNRKLEFIPDWNKDGILNETIAVPNIPLLFMVSFLNDYNSFTKLGFNIMSKSDPLFINTTIYDFLFNFTTPALSTADRYFSFMLPSNNVGLLKNAHETAPEGDHYNVKIGEENGKRDFFKMNTFNYRTTVTGYHLENGDCNASVENSTEGNLYGVQLEKNETLYYWRKSVCRTVPLYFDEEVIENNFMGYKYIAREDMYDRYEDKETDCWSGFAGRTYPDGLSDASHCYMGLPVTMSLPHFYGRDGYWHDKIEGYTPSKEKHTSFAIVEPTLGIPLHQRARTQSNLALPKLSGFRRDINDFSEVVVPLLWIEYSVEELTTPIIILMYFVVNILPIGQHFITVILILTGSVMIYFNVKRHNQRRQHHLEIKLINDGSNTYIDKDNKLSEINDVCLNLESCINDEMTE